VQRDDARWVVTSQERDLLCEEEEVGEKWRQGLQRCDVMKKAQERGWKNEDWNGRSNFIVGAKIVLQQPVA
jgi:hypothetical protein